MADARAASFAKRSIKADAKRWALRTALSMLDLTTLEGKDTPEKVRALCRKAISPGSGVVALRETTLPPMAAVCVYPTMVRVACQALEGTPVVVAAVATGFPSGQYPLAVRLQDVQRAIRDGAHEVDMVISRGLFLAGKRAEVAKEIRETADLCKAGNARLKVILETGELETYDNVRAASDLALQALQQAGAADAFIKTSTGKVQPAATPGVTLVMLEAIRDHFDATGRIVGMKPAGGIRTAKQAVAYLAMIAETMPETSPGVCPWLTPRWFRLGASSLADDLLRQLARMETGAYVSSRDIPEA